MENSGHQWPVTVLVNVMKRDTDGLGIVVSPKTQNPGVIIAELIKDGEAHKTGLLRPGDTILRVNKEDLNGLPYEKCRQILQNLPANKEAEILVRVPDGYTTRLVTTFKPDGTPRTTRCTTPVPNMISPVQQRRRESVSDEKIRKIKSTFDQSSSLQNVQETDSVRTNSLVPAAKQNELFVKTVSSPERPATLSAR